MPKTAKKQSHVLFKATKTGKKMAYVIQDPELGIYIGSCMGLGFWTKVDPIGQPSVVTFGSIQDAEDYMQTWECGRPENITFHEVEPDDGVYASIQACVNAGLEGWLDNTMEMATPTMQ